MNKKIARDLRKRQTDTEKKLWHLLRDRSLEGFKFRRQHPIGPYIVDFCCLEKKLIVEVDGSQHVEDKDYDNQRTQYLNQNSFKVIRFWDNEVLIKPNIILEVIKLELNPHPIPLPAREREKDWEVSSNSSSPLRRGQR